MSGTSSSLAQSKVFGSYQPGTIVWVSPHQLYTDNYAEFPKHIRGNKAYFL